MCKIRPMREELAEERKRRGVKGKPLSVNAMAKKLLMITQTYANIEESAEGTSYLNLFKIRHGLNLSKEQAWDLIENEVMKSLGKKAQSLIDYLRSQNEA